MSKKYTTNFLQDTNGDTGASNPGYVLTSSASGVDWAPPASTITGSGTASYIPMWTPDGTTLGNSVIFQTGTNRLDALVDTLELSNDWTIQSTDGTYWQRIRTADGSPDTTNAFNFETRNGSGSFINHMTILNSGNVGIGTTSPIGKLNIQQSTLDVPFLFSGRYNSENDPILQMGESTEFSGSSSYGELLIHSYNRDIVFSTQAQATFSNVDGSALIIEKGNGNVGIGTNSPGAKLQVEGSVFANGEGNGFMVESGTAATARTGFMKYAGTEGMIVSGNTTKIRLGHRTDSDYVFGASPTIREDLVITTAGNVAIGDTATTYKLFVNGNSRFANSLYVDTNTGADGLWVTRLGGASEALKIYTTDSSSYLDVYQDENQSGYGNLIFRADDTGDKDGYLWFGHRSAGEAMRITDEGFVGINNNTPTFTLDVVGTARVTGDTQFVTQSTTDDSTKVATTAFVKNILAEQPAGLTFLGDWNAATNSPTLASGGGELASGSSTSLAANKLIDSAATFSSDGITVNTDRIRLVQANGNIEFVVITAVDSDTQLALASNAVTATGETYIVEASPFLSPEGGYYIVTTTGTTTLNGISDWTAGDWVLIATNNAFQKIDNTSILSGQGAEDKIAKWATSSGDPSVTLASSSITDTGSAVTIDNPTTVQGVLYLGDSNTSAQITGNTSGNLTIDNNTGQIAFQANGSTVNSLSITSSLITLNEVSQVNNTLLTFTAMGDTGTWNSAVLRLQSTNTVDTTGFQGMRFATSTADNYGWRIGANRSTSGRGSLRFYEHMGAAAGTERFTILQNGNVGIGQSNPGVKLDVSDIIRGRNSIRVDAASTGSPYLALYQNGVEKAYLQYQDSGDKLVLQSDGYFALKTGGESDRITVLDNGNVGIGETNPAVPLHISRDSASGENIALLLDNNDTTAGNEIGVLFRSMVGSANTDFEIFGKANAANDMDLVFQSDGSNERMRITSAGGISFGSTGTAYGTSGQVLTSAGNASPTWTTPTTGTVTGSGEATQVAFWDTSTSLSGDSNLYWDATNDHLGIGDSTPGSRLKVFSGTGETSIYTVDINHVRNDANVSTSAMRINMDLSGADTTTADRSNYGLIVDIDSSANGDASHEHRIYGVGTNVNFTGFTDIARGGNFVAESNYTGGKTASLTGVQGNAVHDTNSTSGGVSNMYGVYGSASIQDLGDVDNAYGGFFYTSVSTNRGASNVGNMTGVTAEVQIDKPDTITYGTITGVSSIIDNNEGSVPTFGTQYLFKGDYQGTRGSDAWGVYCEGNKNYFEGNVGIGLTAPLHKLHVEGSTQLGRNGNNTAGDPLKTIISGQGVEDPATGNFYGSYGFLELNANNNYTGSARRYAITNGLDANKFAIIRSDSNLGTMQLGVAGAVPTGAVADFVINNTGKVGIGTTTAVETLTVPGSKGVMLGFKRFYSNTATVPAGAGPTNFVSATLNDEQGTTLTSQFQYKFYLTTTGTGTYNSSVYIVYRNSADTAWDSHRVSSNGLSSNHPELAISGNNANIYNDHPSAYGVAYRVETSYSAQAKTSPQVFGSDYMWTRDSNSLYYNDGNVGIGTSVPSESLEVMKDGGAIIRLHDPGNNSWKIKADTDFHIYDDSNSDYLTIVNSGNVGIGVTNPNTKLHVAGHVRATSGVYFNSTSTVGFKIENDFTNNELEIYGGSLVPGITIDNSGLLKFGGYGLAGSGTPTKFLGLDSNANVVTYTSGGSLPGGPYLPLAGGTMTGNIHYSAANKATFGTASSPELKIYNNNGGYNFLESSVKFDFNVLELDINGINGTTPIADLGPTDCRFAYSGAYKLYTTTTGITVANTIDFGGGNNDGIIEVSGSGDLIFKYKSSDPALTLDGGAVKTIVHNRLDALGIVSINNANNNESILNIRDDGTNGHIAFENSSEITGIIASDTEIINFRVGDGVGMSDSPVLTLLPNRIGINTTSPNSNVALEVDGRVLIKDSTGVADFYLGNYATANHFRFHTNNINTYFDMNCGNIYWRDGSSIRYTFFPSTANMTVNGTITQNSDIRIKENIVEIGDCISKVQAMKGVYYNRTDFNTEVTKVGVIAQDVEAVLPELIIESPEDGLKSVAYSELTAVLINAIKEQQEIIEDLKTRITKLEN